MVEAVSPTLRIVTDNMLTDSRPLCRIFGWVYVIGLDVRGVLDSRTETVIRLDACLYELIEQKVSKGKIVIRGIVFVGIGIAEDILNKLGLTFKDLK